MADTTDSETLLEAEGLAFIRNGCTLFANLSFSLHPGEILQIEGPNGCGKTTLLRILCGLGRSSSGHIRWRGRDIRGSLAGYASELGYVGHRPGIKDELTPLENLTVIRALGVSNPAVDSQTVLSRVGLAPELDETSCARLSAGERRRVALGRLLMTGARLWVLDEPFTALDRTGRRLFEDLLREHAEAGGVAVLTTHHPMDLAGCRVQPLRLGT